MFKELRRLPNWRWRVAFAIGVIMFGGGMMVVGWSLDWLGFFVFSLFGLAVWAATWLFLSPPLRNDHPHIFHYAH
jgi:hypothetical protein